MYVPSFNAVEDEAVVRRMVATIGSAELITVGPDGYPMATRLPVLWEGQVVVAHMARANGHWRTIRSGSPVLLVVSGAEAYVSPSWYPSKAEHGRVAPTWNYSTVHLTGRATVHDDREWVRGMVTRLTERHEGQRAEPWAVTDAPADFVERTLGGIVGVEVAVERVEAKAKLSQNRSEADRAGTIAGLRATGRARDAQVAADMDATPSTSS